MKILLACPVADIKDYILFEWLKHIQKLTFKPDVFLVDNSSTESLSRVLKRLGINVLHVAPLANDPKKARTMAKCWEVIRAYTLANGYDYFFSLECDVFPPLDIIERLLAMQNDVAGALYCIDTGQYSRLMVQRLEPDTTANETIIRNLTIDESFLFADGSVKYAFGIGLGCVLIHKNVLQKITFRTEPQSDVHPDSILYKDLYALKIPVKVHTGIICQHYNNDWGQTIKQIQNETINA